MVYRAVGARHGLPRSRLLELRLQTGDQPNDAIAHQVDVNIIEWRQRQHLIDAAPAAVPLLRLDPLRDF